MNDGPVTEKGDPRDRITNQLPLPPSRVTGPIGPIDTIRDEWDARCHFCNGPSFPWLTDDQTWAKVEPLLGQHQACFECFAAAWTLQGPPDRPFQVTP